MGLLPVPDIILATMAPKSTMGAMKAMKAPVVKSSTKAMKSGSKAMTKGALAEALATSTDLKKADCTKVINSLAEIVGKEVKKTGKVILPGIAMIKTRVRPATKAGKRMMFGQEVVVKAKP